MPPKMEAAGSIAGAVFAAGLATTTAIPHMTAGPVSTSFTVGAGQSTSGVSANMIGEALVQAKIDASEARVENRLSDKIGSLADQIRDLAVKFAETSSAASSRISGLETKIDKAAGKWTVWGAAGSLFVGGLAVFGLAGDRFDGGVSAANAYAQQIAQIQQQDAAQTRQISAIASKIDKALERQPASANAIEGSAKQKP